MAINPAINQKLLTEAQKIGRHKTKSETIDEALKEYIQRRKQKEVTQLFGQIEFDKEHDYKAHRLP
jgi:metal-responsive CopG/Arc/MetJ family transcriptional regulator